MKLLLVDDERYVLTWLEKLFSETGLFDVFTVSSGQDAIALLDREPIDILLSDIKMPGISGFELAEHIFAHNPDCHVIFLSGYAMFDYVYRANRHNVKYLLKTEDDDVILETVLREKRAIEEARGKPSAASEGVDDVSALERELGAALEKADAGLVRAAFDRLIRQYEGRRMEDQEALYVYQRFLALVIRHAPPATDAQTLGRLSQTRPCGSWAKAYAQLEQAAARCIPGYLAPKSDRAVFAEQVRQYIREHLKDDLSLACIASHFAYNPSYISRLFRQATGENLTDCVKRLRIDSAKERLTEHDEPVQAVAAACGFESPQYFASVFREMTGYAPIEYRKAYLRNK